MTAASDCARRPFDQPEQAVAVRLGPFLASLGNPPFHEFKIAENSGEHVVEVMRDAAGKLANRLKFLRLVQRDFGLFAPGDLDLQPVVRLGQFPRAFGNLCLKEA